MAVVTEFGPHVADASPLERKSAFAHHRELLAVARAGLEGAFAAWERVAMPASEQLAVRIALGEDYVRQHPTEAKAFRLLAQLRRQHKAALAEPIDAARRETWAPARERYQRAEALYLARCRELRERFGLEEAEL